MYGIVSMLCFGFVGGSSPAVMSCESREMMILPDTDPKWNGLGSGIPVANIHTIAVSGCNIYVGGFFTDAGGNPNADYIAMWDGYTWHALGTGCDNTVSTIVAQGDDLYVGGYFQHAGGKETGYLARWDGQQWHSIASSPFYDHYVTALSIKGEHVYAGGFEQIFSTHGRVTYWNGIAWNTLYEGPEDTDVYDILWSSDRLYMTGRFDNLDGQAGIDNIAMLQGTSWQALGAGINRIGRKLGMHGDDLYVVGEFTRAGDNDAASYVARWDGNAWHAVGTEPAICCPITLLIDEDYLYTAGNYGIVHRCHIPSNSWETYSSFNVASYMWVSTLAILGQDLYAGGLFSDASGSFSADHIARWGQPLTEATGLPVKICTTDQPFLLPLAYSGYTGSWTGPGVNGNTFDPSAVHGWISLTFTPDNGNCPTKVDILVEPGTPLEIDMPDTWCGSGESIMLPATVNGFSGKWTGDGVSGNYFHPGGLHDQVTLSFIPHGSGCIEVPTAVIQIKENCEEDHRAIFKPNIFSPDGDGINDIVEVIMSPEIETIFLVRIWSRWGELMHEQHHLRSGFNIVGWDGNHAGNPANTGVYLWMADVQFKDGYRTTYTGDITLIR